MKKTILFLFGLLVTQMSFAQSNCEDPVLANFECVNTLALPGTVTRVANTFSGGVNQTANIGQYADNGNAGFDALILDYGSVIDLTTNNRLKIKLYSPDRSIQIVAKLEGGTASGNQEKFSPFSAIGAWEEFTFDFSDIAADGHTRIVFFFNFNATTGNATDLYYFDDVEWTSATFNTWTGNTDSDWDTASNWTSGSVPTSTTDVLIPNVATKPIASGAISVRNLTIETASSLTVNGAVTNSGKIIVESEASLIAKTSVSGSIAYKRYLSTNNWYLISPSVTGETVEDLIANTSFSAGTGSNLGLAFYENDGSAWNYQTNASTGAFVSGKGVSMKSLITGTVSFSGNMATTDVAVPITDGTANEFNLLGNPYPSYVPANTNADATNNVLTINSAELSENTIWFWDQATSSYITVNNISPSRFIAPGQGFFVSSKTSGGTFNFTEAMQSHQATDVFNKNATVNSEIKLSISNGTENHVADIFYVDSATKGFDNGFDSSMFTGVAMPFAVYTQLVENNTGKNLSIQSLPDSDLENTIVPVGINALSGTEITFSADAQNLPTGVNVYLEDRDLNTFTLLDATSTYKVTLNADYSGTGRFYMRTSSTALSTETNTLKGVNVFNTSDKKIKIIGLNNEKGSIVVFNMIGANVLSKEMIFSNNSEIDLGQTSRGIYIVKLKTNEGFLTKKIIID
ncbi:T9SS type A sorting domain-containing protein [Polaribacter aestuariivivens]|uniref:T9SS type A sorting domain-containing protein n=1 Tax=Polaribacter aestuariivivens TaxID=2304626 RepID=UPI003F4989C5